MGAEARVAWAGGGIGDRPAPGIADRRVGGKDMAWQGVGQGRGWETRTSKMERGGRRGEGGIRDWRLVKLIALVSMPLAMH